MCTDPTVHSFYCGADIILEDQVMVGPYGFLVTGTQFKEDGSYRFALQNYSKIGKGCFLGENAVVISDLPDDTFTAGLPARVIYEWKL